MCLHMYVCVCVLTLRQSYCLFPGIRGEVLVKVKLDMIRDQHRFKQSSCGVRFFTC